MEILKKGRTDIHFFEDTKYGCKCATCGTVFIAERHECNGGYWEPNSLYCNMTVKCPVCGDEQLMTSFKRLYTNIDEECFRKELE